MTGDQTLQSIDDAARQWQSERPERVPALAVWIRDVNGIVLNRSYGIHDSASGKPLEENPLFPIASQSKTFTALAILQLVNERRKHPLTGRPLSLDDQITELLPNLKIDWMEGVTLRDALCHRTLLRGGEASSLSFDELRNLPIKDIKPAEQSGYSNRMYNRLGLIIEDILGDKENGFAERGISTFSDYISKEIVDRHKLGDIYPGYSTIPQQMRARIR